MTQQLESILSKLKKKLAEDSSGMDTPKASQDVENTVDSKAASQALREFLNKNLVSKKEAEDNADDDPRLLVERRKALSNFVGSPLLNNGKAALPGTIEMGKPPSHSKNNSHGQGSSHGAKSTPAESSSAAKNTSPPVPFTPPPAPIVTICPDCVQQKAQKMAEQKAAADAKKAETAALQRESLDASANTKSAKSADETNSSVKTHDIAGGVSPSTQPPKNDAPAHNLGASMGMSVSRPLNFAVAGENGTDAISSSSGTTTKQEPREELAGKTEAVNSNGADQAGQATSKKGVAAFFAAFKPGSKSESKQVVETSAVQPEAAFVKMTAATAAASLAWFKHIQAVESALRIGDIHFADSLLTLLVEVSQSIPTEGNIVARLSSLHARILMDRKLFDDAEKKLNESIAALEGTKYANNVAAAYCWQALALCHHLQKRSAESEECKQKAISIAEAALGPKDPEVMLFREGF